MRSCTFHRHNDALLLWLSVPPERALGSLCIRGKGCGFDTVSFCSLISSSEAKHVLTNSTSAKTIVQQHSL